MVARLPPSAPVPARSRDAARRSPGSADARRSPARSDTDGGVTGRCERWDVMAGTTGWSHLTSRPGWAVRHPAGPMRPYPSGWRFSGTSRPAEPATPNDTGAATKASIPIADSAHPARPDPAPDTPFGAAGSTAGPESPRPPAMRSHRPSSAKAASAQAACAAVSPRPTLASPGWMRWPQKMQTAEAEPVMTPTLPHRDDGAGRARGERSNASDRTNAHPGVAVLSGRAITEDGATLTPQEGLILREVGVARTGRLGTSQLPSLAAGRRWLSGGAQPPLILLSPVDPIVGARLQ